MCQKPRNDEKIFGNSRNKIIKKDWKSRLLLVCLLEISRALSSIISKRRVACSFCNKSYCYCRHQNRHLLSKHNVKAVPCRRPPSAIASPEISINVDK